MRVIRKQQFPFFFLRFPLKRVQHYPWTLSFSCHFPITMAASANVRLVGHQPPPLLLVYIGKGQSSRQQQQEQQHQPGTKGKTIPLRNNKNNINLNYYFYILSISMSKKMQVLERVESSSLCK